MLVYSEGVLNCGISIQGWLIVSLLISCLETITSMLNDKMADLPDYQHRRNFRLRIYYSMFFGVEAFHVSWLIYGNLLYFSEEN